MDNDLLKFNLGKNAEIDSISPEGRYILRYIKANGNINMIAWSAEGPNESLESDVVGQKLVMKLKAELERRDSFEKKCNTIGIAERGSKQ